MKQNRLLDFMLCRDLLQYINQSTFILNHHKTRIFSHTRYDGRRIREIFGSKELDIMASTKSHLNDDCINGISKLLQHIFSDPTNPHSMSSAQCAVFSTHDLLMVRYSATDDEIWRRTHGTQFWHKDVWILPIHRRSPEHWVLAVICPFTHQIFCFDSFSEIRPWKRELKVKFILSFTMTTYKIL